MSAVRSEPDASTQLGVLIVGAGPTGLTLAIELARRGIAFRLIDREPARPETSRALAVQPRTVETCQLMGIPAAALTPAMQTRGIEYREGPRILAEINEFGPLIVEQSTTERVLEQRLTLLGGRIEPGAELVAMRVGAHGVMATVRAAGEQLEIHTRYLVGADGAHSLVRSLAGIGFTGEAYAEDFVLADLELDWPLSHDRLRIWTGDDAVMAAIPLPAAGVWRLVVSAPEDAAPGTGESPDEIAASALQALRERSTLPVQMIGEPIWASRFHIQRRLADRYRDGPVFLAGDAAHVHSPVGGQGMNTGIQDAFNLGWKLALAVRGRAAPGLLDTYEAERREVAREVLRGTDLATRLMLGQHSLARAFREHAVPLLGKLPPVRRRLAHSLSELGIEYPGSPLSVNALSVPGLAAGARVPDASLLAIPLGNPVSLFELISQGWLLLLFPGDRPSPERHDGLLRLARNTRQTAGDMIQCCLIVDSVAERDAELPVLLDPAGELARSFGAAHGLAAVVRPDGYLGYRGRPGQRLELASYLARIYAMRACGLEPASD